MNNLNFKQTEIGTIPEDWEVKSIEELCENLDYMRKPITKSKRIPGDVPYYGAMGVQDHVSGHLFNENLVLVAEDCGDYKGFGQTAYTISGKAWVNNHAHILRCKNIYWVFLKEVLNFTDISRFINTGNREKLNKSVLDKLFIQVPKTEEQQKIASVLSCVDSAIQQTNKVIAQTRTLKKGLMQELLTRGIGHKKFKQTEIGEIPEEWKVAPITEVCKINPRDDLSSLNSTSEVSFIPMEAVAEDGAGTVQKRIAKYAEVQKGYTPFGEGDVLFAKITPCMENGKVAVARNLSNTFGFGSTEFYVLRSLEAVSSEWVFYWISRSEFRQGAIAYFTGTGGQQRVNRKYFEDTTMPIAPENEQAEITKILLTNDNKIRGELEKRSQLELLKKGLMQDLLTGRVRFPEFVKGSKHAE